MPFILPVAADLYGNKINLELVFPSHPSLAELTRVTESTFAVEASILRPDGRPLQPFKVSRFQMYDDRSDKWVELTNAAQLLDNAQIYAFQRETPYHTESQKPIPIARNPSRVSSSVGPASASIVMGGLSQNPNPNSSNQAGLSVQVQRSPRRMMETSPRQSTMMGNDMMNPQPETRSRTLFSDHATTDEKIRAVFEEIDINNNRVIEPDEWKRTLRVLNIDLSSATVSDLYVKADANGDGVISLTEFLNFCSGYPTLLDCLYFRTRDYWEDYSKKQEMKSAQDGLEDLKERERQSRLFAVDAQKDVEKQERVLDQAESELQARGSREKELRVILLDAQRETERGQKERADREQELNMGRERERQRQLAFLESQRDVEKMEKRVAMQDSELGKAQEKERQLQVLLLEAQREVERQHKLVQNTQVDLSESRDREQHSSTQYLDAQRDVQQLSDRVAQGEMDVATKLEREREVETLHLDAQRETARAAHRRDEEERELFAHRDKEQQRVLAQNDTLRAVEDQEKRLRAMESEYQQLLQRRELIEQQEKPLLEQEVRLREQRDNLEEKENRFKSESACFFDTSRARNPTPSRAGCSTQITYSVGGGQNRTSSPPRTSSRYI